MNCPYCEGEGSVYLGNNGPISPCPICKGGLEQAKSLLTKVADQYLDDKESAIDVDLYKEIEEFLRN